MGNKSANMGPPSVGILIDAFRAKCCPPPMSKTRKTRRFLSAPFYGLLFRENLSGFNTKKWFSISLELFIVLISGPSMSLGRGDFFGVKNFTSPEIRLMRGGLLYDCVRIHRFWKVYAGERLQRTGQGWKDWGGGRTPKALKTTVHFECFYGLAKSPFVSVKVSGKSNL